MNSLKTSLLLVLISLFAPRALAQEGPTMGWSSWNTYGLDISDALIRSQADAMLSTGLAAAGYNHINIDDGYFGGRDKTTGQLLIHATRFPNGLRPVVDYIHSLGLKAGIYSDAGHNTCGNYWGGDKMGVGVGLYEHDQQDCDLFFRDLDFDFIKVDFCGGKSTDNSERLQLDERERYTAIAQAIANTGRTDVRMNVCRWAYPGTWVHDISASWRTTGDISDSWSSVKSIIAENLYLSAYCYGGKYNDMDMLEVGRSLTEEEDKTHFGLWCMLSSPLLIGCDLTTIRPSALALLSNRELIALNQDSLCLQAHVVGKVSGCYLLVKDVERRDSTKRAFAVYNPYDTKRNVTVKFDDLDLEGTVKLRDCFEQTDLEPIDTGSITLSLPAHATRIYVAEADARREQSLYEAECAYISDYQELTNNQSSETGIYEEGTSYHGGAKASWLGRKAENDLVWRDVNSRQGGEYTLTVAYMTASDREMTLSVNGEEVKTVTVNSGGARKVKEEAFTVKLHPGLNTVRLSNDKDWMPDVDYIRLEPVATDAVGTPVRPSADARGEAYDLQGRQLPGSGEAATPVAIHQDGSKRLVR